MVAMADGSFFGRVRRFFRSESQGYKALGPAPTVAELGTEQIQSAARTTALRNPFDRSVITTLTPERLARLIRRTKEGDPTDYVVMAGEMEERDPYYYSVLWTRKLAVASLPWVVEAVDDTEPMQHIAEEVTALLKSPQFKLGLLDVLDALGKGYSVVEILWDTQQLPWKPCGYKWKNPRYFHFDRDTAEQIRIRDLSNYDGFPLQPYKYIVHTPKVRSGLALASGLARCCAAMHLFKSYAIRDWMVFAEVFGMPLRVGKYPTGTKPEDVDTLRNAVRDLGTEAGAVMPDTMVIELLRATNSGLGSSDDFFNKLMDAFDRQMSLAVLGQANTSDKGGSFAKAKTLDTIRKDIRDADALQLSATVVRDIVRAYIDLNYGPQVPTPECYPDCSEPEDLKSLADALCPFIDRGLKVEKSVISERFRIPVPETNDDGTEPETLEPDITRTKAGSSAATVDNTQGDALDKAAAKAGPLVYEILQLARLADNPQHFQQLVYSHVTEGR